MFFFGTKDVLGNCRPLFVEGCPSGSLRLGVFFRGHLASQILHMGKSIGFRFGEIEPKKRENQRRTSIGGHRVPNHYICWSLFSSERSVLSTTELVRVLLIVCLERFGSWAWAGNEFSVDAERSSSTRLDLSPIFVFTFCLGFCLTLTLRIILHTAFYTVVGLWKTTQSCCCLLSDKNMNFCMSFCIAGREESFLYTNVHVVIVH